MKLWVSFVILCMFSALNAAQSWHLFESEHFSIYSPKHYKSLAIESLYYLETHRQKVLNVTQTPKPPHIYVVLQDMGMGLNGYSLTNTNKISLFSPAPAGESASMFSRNWLETVSIHEQFHNVHFFNSKFRTPFGLFSTQALLPNTFVEGMAVYMESSLHNYQGRLNDGLYNAMLLTKAKQKTLPSLLQSSFRYTYFPLGQDYLYGSGFVDYLARTYSESTLTTLINSFAKQPPSIRDYFGYNYLNKFSKKEYKKSINTVFENYKTELTTQSKNWILPATQALTTNTNLSQSQLHKNKLYSIHKKTYKVSPFSIYTPYYLTEYDLETHTQTILYTFYLAPITDSLRIHNNSIYIALSNPKLGFNNIDSYSVGYDIDLYKFDLASKHAQKLLSGPILAYDILDNGDLIYAKQHLNSHGCDLINLTNNSQTLASFPFYITQLTHINQTVYMGVKHPQASQDIYALNLTTLTYTPLLNTQAKENSIFLNEPWLYYSANYDHNYQAYRYNLNSKSIEKLAGPSFMSNPITTQNILYYTGLESSSYGLYKTALSTTLYTPSLNAEINPNLYTQTEYTHFKSQINTANVGLSILKTLAPHTRLPFFSYNKKFRLGGFVVGGDKLGYVNYSALFLDTYSQVNIATTYFSPLSLTYQKVNQAGLLSLGYPFYFNAISPIKSVNLFAEYNFNELYPVVYSRFKYNDYELSLTSAIIVNSDVNYRVGLNSTRYFKQSKLNFLLNTTKNMDHYTKLRGLLNTVYSDKTMTTATLEYNHKLETFNASSWKYKLVSADLYGTAFIDYSSYNESSTNTKLVYGYEFSLETGVNSRPFVSSLGASKSDNLNYYLSFMLIY